MKDKFEVMTPKEIVHTLDKFIVGQNDAKRAVAIALRNRWRRMQLDAELSREITPKNILMRGPTGVGKTEIARRLADLAGAPFIKVEATKFTEIGYVGRDVESIIRDLVERSIKITRETEMKQVENRAREAAEERILDILVPLPPKIIEEKEGEEKGKESSAARKLFKDKLQNRKLDTMEINIDLPVGLIGMEILGPPGMEEMVGQLQHMVENIANKRTKTRRLKVKDALKHLQEEEAAKLINDEELKVKALENVEQNGIVFIDEIDKIVKPAGVSSGGEVSREGVQRDLLPLVEGCTVLTKYGMIKTDHILFIASGAFHLAKPSDLIPELQGRFPIRVELHPLTVNDFERIMTEPKASLTEQYTALLSTESVTLKFTKPGIKRLAEIAYQINDKSENIGARRLYTIMEKLLENLLYNACDQPGINVSITAAYVNEQLAKIAEDEDLSQYIL